MIVRKYGGIFGRHPVYDRVTASSITSTFITSGTVTADAYILSSAGVITETSTARTLSGADNGKVIYCTNGSTVTITAATGLGVGFSCVIIQGGAGKITIAAGSATLHSYAGLLSTIGQYAALNIISTIANEFIITGNLGT